MQEFIGKSLAVSLLCCFVLLSMTGCIRSSAEQKYFGIVKVPSDNVLRYVTGSEPESLDPQFVTGQPEARIMMALYEGLVEYHPITMEPIPAIAESWEIGPDGTEYLFHLRKNAKFSNGDPITAKALVYSFRRGLSPELASRNANLAYYLKYAEAYNSARAFVRNPDGSFLVKDGGVPPAGPAAKADKFGPDSEFHRFIDAPERLTVPGDEAGRKKLADKDPKMKALLEGKQFVPVRAEDVGIEAVDDHTVRLKLYQPAPFFLGLLAHQFFRVVHQPTIEKFGRAWTKPENIVTSGPYRVAAHKPYDELNTVKEPNYWDAANVKLAGIDFYPLDEQTTMLNLYKAGELDATYNHTIPAAWNDTVKQFRAEYSLHPEVAVDYYSLSVKKPPMDNLKVRQALSLAIDREALAQFQRTKKPLVDFTPEGIFPKYEEARQKVYTELLTQQGSSMAEWKARIFDAEKARKLMTEAGFPVQKSGSGWSTPSFPVDKVSITYNTSESNQKIAEFIQAQWKQNLGITLPLKNMEFKTFLPYRSAVEYDGVVRNGWVGDYMDPFTFLNLFYSQQNDGATGWWDPKYDKMLDDANKEVDEMKRFEMLATAEFYMMQQQIIVPLCTAGTSWVKKPFIKGMYPNPGTLHAWKFVYLEKDSAKWTKSMDDIMSEKDPAVTAQIDQLVATQEALKRSKEAEKTAE
ncbi:MAG: peptide ABC transporter substrate-binding protein [Pyrinomonadaceae bacterium]